MTIEKHAGFVVGVDGSEGSLAALRYAAHEASRLGSDLCLVHVVPSYVPLASMRPLVPDDLMSTGRAILAEARAMLAVQAPDLEVSNELLAGSASASLLSVAEGARTIVVGRETTTPILTVVTEATTVGVAARSECPVVSVPAGWDPEAPGRVVAAVKTPMHSTELLEQAFAEAAGRGTGLVVLHASERPVSYDEVLEPMLRTFRRTWPDVPVEIRVVHDEPEQALLDAARDASLLLLVRRERGFPAGIHLGRLVRSLLRTAECPVEVVAPEQVPTAGQRELERAGRGPR